MSTENMHRNMRSSFIRSKSGNNSDVYPPMLDKQHVQTQVEKREQSPATMWMSLESIMLSEGSHSGHGLGEFVYSEYPEQANSQRQKVD